MVLRMLKIKYGSLRANEEETEPCTHDNIELVQLEPLQRSNGFSIEAGGSESERETESESDQDMEEALKVTKV